MELVRSLQTMTTRFVSLADPTSVFAPQLVRAIQERYQFWEVPKSIAEFSQPTGAKFTTGLFNETVIGSLQVYSNGILIEGQVNSARLDEMANDLLQFVETEFGQKYIEAQPVAKSFTSSVEVAMYARFDEKFSLLEPFSKRLTSMVAAYGFSLAPYQTTGLIVQTDPTLVSPLQTGRFILERRGGHAHNSNVFYSEAPVSTDEHLDLLGMLEAILTIYSPPPPSQSPPDAPAS